MKKSERACCIMQTLTENPNKDFPLGYFAELFSCAKSSISEDLNIVKASAESMGYGLIQTNPGAKGGVRYVPCISREKAEEVLKLLKNKLEEPERRLGSGFIYNSDYMFDPKTTRDLAHIFARRFASSGAEAVITVETKGIGIGLQTAQLLGLPLVVIRRETSISDGSTVSINFFSGSTDRIQKMSLSKRALKAGTKVLIIDDFMRGGGSIKGVCDMLSEFDASPAGVGVVVAAGERGAKNIDNCFPLLFLNENSDKFETKLNDLSWME